MNKEKIIYGLAAFRRVIYRSLIAVAVVSLISFLFSKKIAFLLIKHVDIKVYYFGLSEVFFSTVELALYTAAFLSFPAILFFVWREMRPLFAGKQTSGYLFLFASIILFYMGAAFCYLLALPSGITFLVSYQGGPLKAMISIQKFLFFCTAMIFAFSVAFELPLVLLVLSTFGVVTGRMLSRARRYAVLFIVIAAAVITPTPDVYNMSLLAVPLYLLYEIGIILIRIKESRKQKPSPAP